MIFFQDILFLKEFLACNICFGLFTKVKKGSGTNILCKFSVWLFHKNVPYLIHYQWTKFQCHTFFPSWYIKQIVLLSSYLVSWRCHKLEDPSSINFKGMAGRGKRREDGNTKLEYVENEKSFSDEIKNIFHSFWLAIIYE